MRVEVFGDVLCPWCYIGKRRIEAAASQVTEAGRVQIVWRSYELDPGAGRILGPTAAEAMSTWWGEKAPERIAQIQTEGRLEGLKLNLHAARPVSSFDAHRLIHLAAERDLASAVMESLLHTYHTEGQNIADPQVLEQLGVKAGLRTVDVRGVLGGDAYALSVRADERRAAALGVTSVPSVVIDGAPLPRGLSRRLGFIYCLKTHCPCLMARGADSSVSQGLPVVGARHARAVTTGCCRISVSEAGDNEADTLAHVEAEGAVRVDVRPEQGRQPAPVSSWSRRLARRRVNVLWALLW